MTASRMSATSSFENGGLVLCLPASVKAPPDEDNRVSGHPFDVIPCRSPFIPLLPGTRCHKASSAKCVSEGQRYLSLSLDHLRPHLLDSSRHLLFLCHCHRAPLLGLGLRDPLVGFSLIRPTSTSAISIERIS